MDYGYTQIKKQGEYKYEELTGKIIACAFEVQNNLGCGFLEKVYHKALLYELKKNGLKVETQKAIKIVYKGEEIGIYIADFVIEDKVIVELKTVEFLSKIHKAQTLNYLKASGCEVGLILNFARPKLEYKRVVI
ncbi:MAG: GxxExxY protein [Candidatus Omnitrophota bacterium]|nr:GxxExxY protein [Candidatus Omnitrophota bacterium]